MAWFVDQLRQVNREILFILVNHCTHRHVNVFCNVIYFFAVDPVIQFPHDVITNVAVCALPTVGEDAIPIDIDPPSIEGTQGNDDVQPSTSTAVAQQPVTNVSAVSKAKGRSAKKARHHDQIESAVNSNTAVTYLDLATDEPVSKKGKCYPAYLLNPAPSTLGIDELHKHGIISDIEKNRALTRLANAFIKIAPHLHNFLKKLDPTLADNRDDTDHDYHAT